MVVVHVHVTKGRGDTAPVSALHRGEWSASYSGHVIPQGKGPEVAKCWYKSREVVGRVGRHNNEEGFW
jgi:hypothetical protein